MALLRDAVVVVASPDDSIRCDAIPDIILLLWIVDDWIFSSKKSTA
jgi:hypothetical protein